MAAAVKICRCERGDQTTRLDARRHYASIVLSAATLKPTKPPQKPPGTYERPTPKVSRPKRGKILSPAEREAFVASRPDLKKPS